MKLISSNLAVYGIAHALVDAVCAGILFTLLTSQVFSTTTIVYLFLIYNLLAFGLQFILGAVIDYLKTPRLAAILGLALTGISAAIFVPLPVAAVVLAGTGNALFHVGGGVISLHLTPSKATAPGIFVAPGALGLMAGTLLGRNSNFIAWPFLLAAVVLCGLFFLSPLPATYRRQAITIKRETFKFEYLIYLVLFVIAVRSLVGFAVVFPWKADINLLVWLTLAVALGKGLGGWLADRFGWALTAVGSLVISIPLLALGPGIAWSGMLGMFLFNITMPVTLVLISNMMPGKPGFAFGLTCLGLIVGALPVLTGIQVFTNNWILIVPIICISAIALLFSLNSYHQGRMSWKTELNFRAGQPAK